VARFDRDLEVAELQLLEQLHLLERRLDESLGLIGLRELLEVLRQRPGVGADPHRNACLLRRLDDERHLVGAADVARVDPHGRDPRVDRLQGERRVEVDVRDHRKRREPDDSPQRLGILDLRHGTADDLATG
jgi:hypothetical protein